MRSNASTPDLWEAMSSLRDLPWLVSTPEDFRQRCKRLADLPAEIFGPEVRLLGSYALQLNQLHQLAKVIECRRAGGDLAPLQPLKLALVSNGTTDLMAKALIATGVRYGFDVEVIEGLFGQVVQESVDPKSLVNKARADFVLLAINHRVLMLNARPGDEVSESAQVNTAAEWLLQMADGFRRHGGATTLVPTFAPPVEPLFGSLDAVVPGSLPRILQRLNQCLAAEVRKAGNLLLDTAALAAAVGLDEWDDDAYWVMGKLLFGQAFLPLYADHVLRLIAAARGKARKCLVLDLDNTVWGGVIGDDGLNGIVIGNGSPRGEAHLAVQRLALALRERGVMLAVSSKNEDCVARSPFQVHPEMLLKESHLAVFQANWMDKATNLRAIANELNIGLDAMVLLDDNPAERALIRRELPEVAVPELSADPAAYARTLAWAGYFEAANYSVEDAERATYYEANAKRAKLAAQITDMDGYLASLDMVMTVSPFGPIGRGRITQLINKTNQFNLTTRRYTEQQVEAFEAQERAVTIQWRLTDKFGDNGIIGVIIGLADGDVLDIDSFLMSCRVLNRGIERAALNVLVAAARAKGYRYLRGRYLPTAKNELVRDLYACLGFVAHSEDEIGSVFVLPIEGFTNYDCRITVVVRDEE